MWQRQRAFECLGPQEAQKVAGQRIDILILGVCRGTPLCDCYQGPRLPIVCRGPFFLEQLGVSRAKLVYDLLGRVSIVVIRHANLDRLGNMPTS